MKIEIVQYCVIPTGEYVAKVAEITQEDGKYGPQLKWTFEVLASDGSIKKSLFGWTSVSPSLKGKFAKWASACLGRALGPGDAINTSDLIGSKATLVVLVKEDDDGGEFNKVETVKPYRKGPSEPDADEDIFGNE